MRKFLIAGVLALATTGQVLASDRQQAANELGAAWSQKLTTVYVCQDVLSIGRTLLRAARSNARLHLQLAGLNPWPLLDQFDAWPDKEQMRTEARELAVKAPKLVEKTCLDMNSRDDERVARARYDYARMVAGAN